MMIAKHNKKRNTGIIYELLLRQVSSGIVEGVMKEGDVVVGIIKRHFKPDSELYKEFRLFNALVKTDASSEYVADIVMREAKEVAKKINVEKLDEEKTVLIHHINHKLDKEKFYNRRIPDYRMYATIQTLINDWRNPNQEIVRRAQYEEKVRTWLLQKKDIEPGVSEQRTEDVDPLVLKIMSEKISKKFSSELSSEQKKIVNSYTLSGGDKNEELTQILSEIKKVTLNELDKYTKNEKNFILLEKVEKITGDVKALPTDNLDEEMISRFLTVTNLRDTLTENEK